MGLGETFMAPAEVATEYTKFLHLRRPVSLLLKPHVLPVVAARAVSSVARMAKLRGRGARHSTLGARRRLRGRSQHRRLSDLILDGKPLLSFLNLFLYSLTRTSAFRDITAESNSAFHCGTGYDQPP